MVKESKAYFPKKETLKDNFKRHWPLYLMCLPGVLYLLAFKYIPLLGSVIAFQDYSVHKGILESQFVGLANFRKLFQYPDFYKILGNTLALGLIKTVLLFPIPVILAIMINEVQNKYLKKSIQTAIYIPYFLSWVIVGGVITRFFGMGGLFNIIRNMLGMRSKLVMQMSSWFRPIYAISSIWKESGWGTVVYLAAISGIDVSLYEAATVDGASRWQRFTRITFPLLMPTILTIFLLNIGSFLDLGFEQVYNLMTPMTQSVADIFDTYVFRVGVQQAQYSFTTAVGLFQSLIGLAMVVTFNKLANRVTDDGGLW